MCTQLNALCISFSFGLNGWTHRVRLNPENSLSERFKDRTFVSFKASFFQSHGNPIEFLLANFHTHNAFPFALRRESRMVRVFCLLKNILNEINRKVFGSGGLQTDYKFRGNVVTSKNIQSIKMEILLFSLLRKAPNGAISGTLKIWILFRKQKPPNEWFSYNNSYSSSSSQSTWFEPPLKWSIRLEFFGSRNSFRQKTIHAQSRYDILPQTYTSSHRRHRMMPSLSLWTLNQQ